ncbi:unnamed protein product [Symbiodinium natans]|uniref:Uncharacterized protein n=1 Tax=Symbiodinium natans TaxID=878477 RepID=A0A812P1J9_9DINO|nr:unnamed protein product [Symbiodinium natans]
MDADTDMATSESGFEEQKQDRWFPCAGCDLIVTCLVRAGHPHPGTHHYYSYTHCCKACEEGQGHSEDQWACASVPSSLFRTVEFDGRKQHYLLHDPGSQKPLPVLLFLHGAHTYIYPETLWWDVRNLLENNQKAREEFIVLAPFGSVGEPVVHPSEWMKRNRFQIEEPYVKCFDVEILWSFFLAALRDLGSRADLAQLHVTGYSMGGQATWGLASRFGSRLASVAPMAACCAWAADAWDHEAAILQELGKLPLWFFAGEEDVRTVSWRDFWWLADKRGYPTKAPTQEIQVEGQGVGATLHDWAPDLQLALLRGTRTSHSIWDPVYHNEANFGLFTRMAAARCPSPMTALAEGRTPCPAPAPS